MVFRTRLLGCAFMLWLGVGVVPALQAGELLPEAAALRTDQPPIMDGKLDEAFWKEAKSCGEFKIFDGRNKISSDTEFKIAYDNTWLYLGFDCKNPKMDALQPKIKGHDKGACNDESVEVFLDPGTAGKMYLHYMLSFSGARDEKRIMGGAREIQWDVPWRAATNVRHDGWSAEVALPLYILASYGALDKISLNVARNRRIPEVDQQGVTVNETRESSIWSPVLRSFHEPDRFGHVTGIRDIKLQTPFLVRVKSVSVEPYYFETNQSFYGINLEIMAENNEGGAIEIVVTDKPVSGKPREVVQKLALAGSQKQELRLAVPVDSMCEREAVIRLKNSADNEIMETLFVEDFAALSIMTACLDRNYYTTEKSARAVCAIGLPESSLTGLELVARDGGTNVMAVSGNLKSPAGLEIPLDKLPLGLTPLKIELRKKTGELFYSVPLNLRKREPKPGLEWKIDQVNRVALNNNAPFFLFGMCMGGVKPGQDAAFKQLADHGFNTFMVWAKTNADGMAKYHEACEKYNLVVIAHPDDCVQKIEYDLYKKYSGDLLEQVKRATRSVSLIGMKGVMGLPIPVAERTALYGEFYSKNITNCLAAVNKVKDFRNLCGYFIFDEPVAKTYFDQTVFGQDYYKRIHEADGYHPVLVNYSSYIPEGDEYMDWCDIIMTDPYWSPARLDQGTRGTPNHVSKITWTVAKRAQKFRQPLWQVLAGPLWSGCTKRPLNHDELRCQTYLALIHGAAGILYFSYEWVREDNWVTFKELAAEMKELAPALLASAARQEIIYRRAVIEKELQAAEYTLAPFNPDKEEYPEIQACLKQNPAGGHILLAANSAYYPVQAKFKVSGLTAKVQRLFRPAQLKTVDEAFSDTLAPYATAAYALQLPDQEAIKIDLAMTVIKSAMPPQEIALPCSYRPGKKNLMPNPSFEDEGARNWPDYSLISQGVTLDRKTALFGKKSLKLVKTAAEGKGCQFGQFGCSPQIAEVAPYTFSVYLKGSRSGLKAWIRGTALNDWKTYGEEKTVVLTNDWQRYSITGVLPAKVSGSMFEIRLMEEGEMWADGMQLEKGSDATEYTDD